MRCAALVLKKQSYPPPWGAALDEEGAAGGTDGGDADGAHRHRRKRHRRGRLTFDLGEDGGGGTTPVSSAHASRSERSSSPSSSASSTASDDEGRSSSSLDDGEDGELVFVPDILVDGFPYWTTEDQLKLLFKEYGNVLSIQISSHDLSGAFTGSVLVRMETAEQAVRLSEEMHGRNYNGCKLVAGVLNEKLELVSLANAHEIRQAGAADPEFVVTRNERSWA